MLIAEEALLALVDPRTGSLRAGSELPVVLTGALLAELALMDRLVTTGRSLGRSTLVAAAPAGRDDGPLDPVLTAELARLARPQPVSRAVRRGPQRLADDLFGRLVHAGALRPERHRILGLVPSTRWVVVGPARADVVGRMRAVLLDGAEPDPRTAALVGILAAADRAHVVLDVDRAAARRAKARGTQVAEGSVAAAAVAAAIRAIQSEITAAVVVATTVAAGGATSSS